MKFLYARICAVKTRNFQARVLVEVKNSVLNNSIFGNCVRIYPSSSQTWVLESSPDTRVRKLSSSTRAWVKLWCLSLSQSWLLVFENRMYLYFQGSEWSLSSDSCSSTRVPKFGLQHYLEWQHQYTILIKGYKIISTTTRIVSYTTVD